MISFPIKYDNVLPLSIFTSVSDEIASEDSELVHNNGSNEELQCKFFGQSHRWDRLVYYQAATTILLKVKRYLRQDIRLLRIHSGAKYFGCEPAFHTDFKEDYCFTFVLFTNRYWNTNWGGEFIAQNPITNEYNYVPYIPNNGVLVPSNWEHTGTPPITPKAGLRTSVAFVYCIRSRYEEIFASEPKYKDLMLYS